MSNDKVVEDSHFLRFKIQISNFTIETGKCEEFLINNEFSVGTVDDPKWFIQIYPRGYNEKFQDNMGLYCWFQYKLPIQAHYKFWFINKFGDEKKHKALDYLFHPTSPPFGWHRFIKRSVLFDDKNALLNGNTLTIAGEVKFQIQTKFKMEEPLKSAKLQHILQNKSFTDVTIKVKEKTIKAHKILLAENSPVLYEKLLLPENQNDLEIEDVEFNVVKEMLIFLYNDKIDDLEANSKSLLRAADLYKMSRLKKYCEASLFENLSLENAIETLLLARECDAQELYKESVEFIGRHIKDINHDWQSLIKPYPAVFNDIFKYCVGKIHEKLIDFYKMEEKTGDSSINFPEYNLSQDFERLLNCNVFSDVKLEVEGNILNAHKVILSSRSTVFQAMFHHDTLEAKSNRVVIKDFDLPTIQELLRFIYSGKVVGLKNVALNLLQAADKYNLIELRNICAEFLKNDVTVENVTDVLSVADMHNCEELRKEAVSFLGRNILEVIKTSKWVKFIELKPSIMTEIFVDWVNRFY